jgi:putative endonuclease
MQTIAIGKSAEQKACAYLKDQGLMLLTANYRTMLGEIDLIMQDKNTIVFIEIRSKSQYHYGDALSTIDYKKQRKLIKTAYSYLQNFCKTNDKDFRFDVIGIKWLDPKIGKLESIEWIKNAFSLENL